MKVYTIFDVKSPVQLNNVTPRRNWSVVLEDRTYWDYINHIFM